MLQTFVKLTAPVNKIDFVFKLSVFMAIGGGFNHLRHILTHGMSYPKSYWENLIEASFTALPMCAFALLLIGHLYSLQQQLYLQATQDPLTGLNNRRWFLDNTPQTPPLGSALMAIDVDHFKTVNDAFGHEVGDECLRAIADHIRRSMDTTPTFARIGGEEFAAYFEDLPAEDLHRIADRLSLGFRFHSKAGESWHITMSVGILMCNGKSSRSDTLRYADEALYVAKSKGRACYETINTVHATFPQLHPAITPQPRDAGLMPKPLRRMFTTS